MYLYYLSDTWGFIVIYMIKAKTLGKNLIVSLAFVAISFAVSSTVYACNEDSNDCGYGEKEIVNKRFSIEKKVRIEGNDSWKDKVTGVEEDDIVEFKIKIKNLSDDKAADEIDFDNMKMEDILPDEMFRVGGSGLTEYWDDFEPGETKTFKLEAKVDADEYDNDKDFEKCVVNKAKTYWDGEFEGSDTATVCYSDIDEPTELPETGVMSTMLVAGALMVASGILIKAVAKRYSRS
jgi:hypothetical protein